VAFLGVCSIELIYPYLQGLKEGGMSTTIVGSLSFSSYSHYFCFLSGKQLTIDTDKGEC